MIGKVREIDKFTYLIEECDDKVSVYMYLLIGAKKALLIDTGWGMINLKEIISELTDLPVEVINTHGHIDHIGGNILFEKVYLHEDDKLTYLLHSSKKMHGLFPDYQYRLMKNDITYIKDNYEIDLGNRLVKIIATPGHSFGSICILDVNNKWLFTGDTCCLKGVLLQLEYSNTVEEYEKSILKLINMQGYFNLIWPSHHFAPVDLEVLNEYLECIKLIYDNKIEGNYLEDRFGPKLVAKYKRIGVSYLKERIFLER